MNILVVVKMVPDVVEELEVAQDGKALDTEFLRLILSESDDHALEQAVLLKERRGGKVTVLAMDAPEIDDALYTALAKGADRAIKVTAEEPGLGTQAAANLLAEIIRSDESLFKADLILTGTQALDDLDGLAAPMIACGLGRPYLGIVTAVAPDEAGGVTVVKEYPESIRGEFTVALPAVLGIQAAEKPPRYVPVAKVRAAMKTLKIETLDAPADGHGARVEVLAMSKPVATGQAEMLEGTAGEVSAKIREILASRGLL
jgi:electron transfer flavoprotein beta subunit